MISKLVSEDMPLQQAKVTKFLLFYLSEGENFIKGLLGPIGDRHGGKDGAGCLHTSTGIHAMLKGLREQPKQAIEFFF